ncbi:hypothetical protein C0991_000252 [Blastosporella zonata]|nr:hypothetical protein C0991_000252 [Blastosporella zonata]
MHSAPSHNRKRCRSNSVKANTVGAGPSNHHARQLEKREIQRQMIQANQTPHNQGSTSSRTAWTFNHPAPNQNAAVYQAPANNGAAVKGSTAAPSNQYNSFPPNSFSPQSVEATSSGITSNDAAENPDSDATEVATDIDTDNEDENTTQPSIPVSNKDSTLVISIFYNYLDSSGSCFRNQPAKSVRRGVPLSRKRENLEIPEDIVKAFAGQLAFVISFFEQCNISKFLRLFSGSSNANISSSGVGESQFAGAMDPSVIAMTVQGSTSTSMNTPVYASSAASAQLASAFPSASAFNAGPSSSSSNFSGNTSNTFGSTASASNASLSYQPNGVSAPAATFSKTFNSTIGTSSVHELGAPPVAANSDMDTRDYAAPQSNFPSLLSHIRPSISPLAAPAISSVNPASSNFSSAFSQYTSTTSSNAFVSAASTSSVFSSHQNPDSSDFSSQNSLLSRIGPPASSSTAPIVDPASSGSAFSQYNLAPSSNVFGSTALASSAFSTYQPNGISAFTFVNSGTSSAFAPHTSSNPVNALNKPASSASIVFPSNQTPSDPVPDIWTGNNHYQIPFSSNMAPSDSWFNSSNSQSSSHSLHTAPVGQSNVNAAPSNYPSHVNSISSVDFIGSDQWTNNSFTYPLCPTATQVPDSDVEMDVEMEIYDPHGVSGIPAPVSDYMNADAMISPWQEMALPAFSFEQNQWENQVSAHEQQHTPPVYVNMVEGSTPIPLRQRSEHPIAEPSSLHLGPQIEWMQKRETLLTPERATTSGMVLKVK